MKVKKISRTQGSGISTQDEEVKHGDQVIGESGDQTEELKNQETEKQKDVEELKNRLARALADYDNLIKRFSKQQDEIIIRSNKHLLEDLLPILDNLERAQSHLKDQGLQMAIDELGKVLYKYGLTEIDTNGEFDSRMHEAIDYMEGGVEGKIAQIVTKGYQWRDGMVLRPAKVTVYKKQN